MSRPCPRLLLAALRGGAGKTTLTLGLLAAWRAQDRKVIPFKKGPDYIDPAWHALAAGSPSHNLDPFLMEGDQILALIARHVEHADALLIEGNRGLYDGLDAQGTYSTAELAKFLATPVVLVVDCTMTTRTVAALILGCQHFDPQVPIAGVILNQVARPRHEAILRDTIEHYCGVPVFGALPRLKCAVFPERHMGLVPPQEHHTAQRAVSTARDLAERYLDLDGLWRAAANAPPLPQPQRLHQTGLPEGESVTLGVIRDSAFQFYYSENLEALEREGARLVEVSALSAPTLPPDLDGLYIGGGFPETHAQALAENETFRLAVKQAAGRGLPIYAECGGLMYLGAAIKTIEGERFPMVGIFPCDFIMGRKPQGHGYTVLEVVQENPYFPPGTRLKGHEFHYSHVNPEPGPEDSLVFHVVRGAGIGGNRDGLLYKNVLATYTHLHALGAPSWAPALVRLAREYRRARRGPWSAKVLKISELRLQKRAG
ncbi:MAG: cobyrinate a,c-diamide synthase [Deltaproteobacteria bacterium]|nr:cobyrinate a,c-diamide synthase [Deltaproteobacteria bacterium]